MPDALRAGHVRSRSRRNSLTRFRRSIKNLALGITILGVDLNVDAAGFVHRHRAEIEGDLRRPEFGARLGDKLEWLFEDAAIGIGSAGDAYLDAGTSECRTRFDRKLKRKLT